VGVLYAFSTTLGEGIGLVCIWTSTCLKSHFLMFIFQVFSPAKVISAGVGVLLLVRIPLYPIARALVTPLLGSYGCSRKPGHSHRRF
jgi:hypothetical protein